MDRIIRIMILLSAITFTYAANANQCGLKPLTPLGCSDSAQCRCNVSGACEWVFDCGNSAESNNPATFNLGESLNAGAQYKARQLQNQRLEQELDERKRQRVDPAPVTKSRIIQDHNFGFSSGNTWLRACRDYPDSIDFKLAACEMLTKGLVEGFYFGHIGFFEEGDTPTKPYCIERTHTLGQYILVIRKFILDHPEHLNKAAPWLVHAALDTAFPCESYIYNPQNHGY